VEVLLELGAGVVAPDPLVLALSASTVLLLLLFALYVFKRLFGSARARPRGRPARTPAADRTAAAQQRTRSEQQRQRRLTEALLQALRHLAVAPHDGNAIHSADAVSRRGTTPTLSSRACSARYGLQSLRRDWTCDETAA
jgi:hypothetical protein